MASVPSSQPSHLTLTELVLNGALFALVGYWIAGRVGVGVGLGLLMARYAYLIWVAAYSFTATTPLDERFPQASDQPPTHSSELDDGAKRS